MIRKSRIPHWHQIAIVFIAVVALLFGFARPAGAISYGTPDGNAHPYVGSMVLRIPGEGVFQWCSGTLIADKVFLTASHCTAPVDETLAQYPGSEMLVTFDPTISESGTFYTGTWHTNPEYLPGTHQTDPRDVAVIVLDQAPPIPHASLPTAGLLDQYQSSHALKDMRFTAVGYGTIRDVKTGGPAGILDNVDRNRAGQGFLSLTKAWLTLSMNLSTGSGGGCYGDSGGPHFIGSSNVVASITVTGDAVCVATDKTYRMDTESARSFLAQYVPVP
jgi:secreted trypsin-like serine protease